MTEQVPEPVWYKRFEIVLLLMAIALFASALVELRSTQNTREMLPMLLLSGVLMLQPAASLVRQRSRLAYHVLLTAAVLLATALLLASCPPIRGNA